MPKPAEILLEGAGRCIVVAVTNQISSADACSPTRVGRRGHPQPMVNPTVTECAVVALLVGAMLAVADRDVSAGSPGQARPQSVIDVPRALTPTAGVSRRTARTPCRTLPERGGQMILNGDHQAAEQALVASTRQCPDDPAVRLEPRQVVTEAVLARAVRRLRDAPVVSNARMKYAPIDGGLATIDFSIDELKLSPGGWRTVATIASRAALRKELRFDVAGPLSAAELTSVAWRWASGRPRVAVATALPSPRGLPGVISLDASWDRQTYSPTPAPDAVTLLSEDRRRVGLHIADGSSNWFRWQAGASVDRLRERGNAGQSRSGLRDYLSADGTLEVRLAGDRVALAASAGWWVPIVGGSRFGAGGLLAAWRSTADAGAASLSASAELSLASRASPLALWQGAGTGQGRTGLLRAHPLLHGSVLSGSAFGRELVRGTLEYVRPAGHVFGGAVAVAGFVDAARAWHRLDGLDRSSLYVDAGVGIRVRTPGRSGAIRIDLARGLRGGGTTLSAGWTLAWPR